MESRTAARSSALKGPEEVVLEVAHLWGPLAGRGDGAGGQVRGRVSVCAEASPVVVTGWSVAPLRREGSGTTAPGRLAVALWEQSEEEEELPRALGLGQCLDLRLTVRGMHRPGVYRTELTCRLEDGPPLAVPVRLVVRAHLAWAVVFVLLGLSTLGLLGFLNGETAVSDERARTLEAQRRFHEHLDRFPTEDSLLVQRTEDRLVQALEVLSQGRPLSLRDDRLAQAARLRRGAAEDLATLEQRVAGMSPGEVGWQRLQEAWKSAQERLAAAHRWRPVLALEAEAGAEPPGDLGEESLGLALQGFLAAQFEFQLGAAAQGVEGSLEPRVEAVALALGAGEDERARRMAAAVLRQLRRGMQLLEKAVHGYSVWRGFAHDLWLSHQFLTDQRRTGGWAPEARRQVEGLLAEASDKLSTNSTPRGFQQTYNLVQQARTEAARADAQVLIQQVQAALDESTAATSLEWIEGALARLPLPETPEIKLDNNLALLELWRDRVEAVADPHKQSELTSILDAMEAAVRAGDWETAVEHSGELVQSWMEHGDQVQLATTVAVLGPACRRSADQLRVELAGAREQMRLVAGQSGLAEIDRQLEQVARWISSMSFDADCLEEVLKISGKLLDVGSDLLAVSFSLLPSVDESLRETARGTGAAAMAEAERLLRPVRPLDVTLRTPPDQRVAGRTLAFEVGHLQPLWGVGTEVVVDFGDGSEPWVGDAETLRQQPLLQYRYDRPRRYVVEVRVTELTTDGASFPHSPATRPAIILAGGLTMTPPPAAPELLGEGRVAVDVAPDPVSGARRLAGIFLNFHFILALAAALLIQGWRLTSERPFGIRGRDYLEAFAVGLGAYAAIESLTSLLPQLLS